jgi:protein tyrosine/serine phosphatase
MDAGRQAPLVCAAHLRSRETQVPLTPLRTRAARAARRLGLAVAVALAALAAHLTIIRLDGNFHTVIAGHVYRSGQPDAADLRHWTRAYGIRTVVNLRGAADGADWYDTETATASALGLAHVDFGMSASHDLTPADAAALIAVLAEAEMPILIHCKAGADRTGLAAALYVAAIARGDEEAAERQISLRFGHISLPMVPEYAMDRTFERLEPWLGYPNS